MKLASEMVTNSRQPLKPGTLAAADQLFSEPDKPITSMPSHHNLGKLFEVLTESSQRFFDEL